MIESLLTSIADQGPSGPCLEYDPRFQALISASLGREEQQLGSNIVPAEEPDWRQLSSEAAALLSSSHDIRVVVVWTLANLRLSGLPGYAQGLSALAQLLDREWDTVHPVVETDGDWYMRSNAVAGLAAPDSMLRSLRNVAVETVLGTSLTVREVCSLAENQPLAGLAFSSLDTLRQALLDAKIDLEGRKALCTQIAGSLGSIRASFAKHLGIEAVPSLDAIEHVVDCLRRLYTTEAAPDVAPPLEIAPSLVAATPVAAPSGIKTRDDAIRALAACREYFERNEPANPAAILIRRVERLATASFLDIMEEMAPSSMDHIKMQAGLNR